MDANDKKDAEKPEVYKIVTLGQGNVNRREFVKSLAVATGVAVLGMGADEGNAQNKNGAGPAVNLLLLDDGVDPCSIGCQCHMVCPCQSVGACVCDVVRSTCKQGSNGRTETYDQVQQFHGSVCTCDRVAVCTCNTVCTCNAQTPPCSCYSNYCSCNSQGGGGYISYWYPN